eukprot:464014_1
MLRLYKKGRGDRAKKIEQKQKKKNKKSPASRRMQTDFGELELPENCSVDLPDKDNLQEFSVKIKMDSGYWKNATYTFNFVIPENYPHEAPKVTCKEKVYHPNINLKGSICLNVLSKDWTAVLSIQQVIHGLIFLFLEPNGADPLNLEAAKVLRENKASFASKVEQSIRGEMVDGTRFESVI